jgi:hypothetical protein
LDTIQLTAYMDEKMLGILDYRKIFRKLKKL